MKRSFAISTVLAIGCPCVMLVGGCGASDANATPNAPDGAGGASPAVDAAPPTSDASSETASPDAPAERFSFFVTSLAALRDLSGNADGFGGDLRFGQADGLAGADEICRQIAQRSMPGNVKTWRAFLSVTRGPDGQPVHAIDRIGQGPWYDRLGRVVALTRDDLVQPRPRGA